ncbi:MAG: trypsin-like peptidase domain-containing protein [Zoogloeaceae bacterium]|nr:trypsin-like peptidase domain-containing protein [Rhodocyclaceae bacterium]MCP5234315.1 trypsin-like peptidase domain-containing protein [Zoogloeaceae bacterium]
MIESILLAAAAIGTHRGDRHLSNASGFFFERDERLFLVSSRHVLRDDASGHQPDRLTIDIHTDPDNVAECVGFSVPLYRDGRALWRQGSDEAGEVDVAVIELKRDALPEDACLAAFTPAHLLADLDGVEVGTPLLVIGFPLGFGDELHRLPVARQAIVASSFGLRFQGSGYFLTDARTHRGISGAPVVMRAAKPGKGMGELPWHLLGIHSARLDMGSRDHAADEALGLNCAWYADMLMTLTEG